MDARTVQCGSPKNSRLLGAGFTLGVPGGDVTVLNPQRPQGVGGQKDYIYFPPPAARWAAGGGCVVGSPDPALPPVVPG